MIISALWVWMSSMWSTFAACSASMNPPKGRSRHPSRFWPNFSAGPGAPYRAEQCHAYAGRGRTPDLRDRLHTEPLQSGPSDRQCPDRRSRPRRHRLCAVFPLGGFTPLQSSALSDVAQQVGATPMQVALACCSAARPTSFRSPAPRPSRICGRTSPRLSWICRATQ